MTVLPPDLPGMRGLLVELAPRFTFTMSHERGIGWDSESIVVSALPRCPEAPPYVDVLSVWRFGGRWRFCLRPHGPGAVRRGPLRDEHDLRGLLVRLGVQ